MQSDPPMASDIRLATYSLHLIKRHDLSPARVTMSSGGTFEQKGLFMSLIGTERNSRDQNPSMER